MKGEEKKKGRKSGYRIRLVEAWCGRRAFWRENGRSNSPSGQRGGDECGGQRERKSSSVEVGEGGGKGVAGEAMTHRGTKKTMLFLFEQSFSSSRFFPSFLSFHALERKSKHPCSILRFKTEAKAALRFETRRRRREKRFFRLVAVAIKKTEKQLFHILPSMGSAAPSSRGSSSGCIGWVEPPDVRLLRAAGGCCDEWLFSLAAVSSPAAASAKISSPASAPTAAAAGSSSAAAAAAAPCDGDGERDAARVRRPRRGGTVNVPSPLLGGGDGRSERKKRRWGERDARGPARARTKEKK